MRTRLVEGLAVALICGLWLAPAPANAQTIRRPDVKTAVKGSAAAVSAQYEKSVTPDATCMTADAKPATKEVWAAQLACKGGSQLKAGFRLAPLTTAAPIPNAKIVATFEVSQVVGSVSLSVASRKGGMAFGVGNLAVSRPGTYTVTSQQPFTLEADQPFKAEAHAYFGTHSSGVDAVVLRITEIKWEF